MPNFVDCEVFRPAGSLAEKQALRVEFGIPINAMVIISVAALKRGHKRVDQVISEFKAAARHNYFLILAGATTDETPGIKALAGGDPRIRIFQDYPHEKMSMLLRAADVMVLGSLFEMMPIAVLEGLASGLPVISHDHPVMAWMTGAESTDQLSGCQVAKLLGESPSVYSISSLTTEHLNNLTTLPPGGMAIDMSRDGSLAKALAGLTPEWIAVHGRQARARAETMFSKDVVIGQYVEYYKEIMKDHCRPTGTTRLLSC